MEVLKPFERYAVAGSIGGPLVDLDVGTLYLNDLSLFGYTVLDKGVFPKLVERIEAGEVIPAVANTFSLQQFPKAQIRFETKQDIGKLVVGLSV